VLCVNKMDLVDFSQERFEEIRDEFRQFATKL
jgi:bifunctional enzyme CysN/CysC